MEVFIFSFNWNSFSFFGYIVFDFICKGGILEGKQLFFSEFIKQAKSLNPVWLKAAFIFIFVGLSTKMGIAPMHPGDVDATSNSPSPIAALMSGSLRVTALLGVLRVFQIASFTSTYNFARLIMIIGGLLSLFVTFIFMFKVKNYKRLLAYSSVEHLGIITLGIGTGGIAFIGVLYHIIYNSINKIVLFLSAGNIHLRYKTRQINSVNSALNILPWSGWILLVAFFAISGVPPFGIFFSELKIFEGILFSENPWLLAVVMFLLLFIFINMGKKIFQMLYRKDDNLEVNREPEKFDISHLVSIFLLILLIVIAVFTPDALSKNVFAIAKDFGVYL